MAHNSIMIVEDEYVTSTAIKGTIEDMGYSTVGVAAGEDEAVEMARVKRPDLILMDIVLKDGGSGISAAAKIRKELDIPVIYLTAHSSPDVLKRARVTGPFGYIVKPFADGELRANIEMALYKHRLEHELGKSGESIMGMRTLISICMDCRLIRNNKGRWVKIENYIVENWDAEFSHGLCPICQKKMIDDFKEGN